MNEKLKRFFSFKTLLTAAIAVCIVCLIPVCRTAIMSLVEQVVMGRTLRDPHKWDDVLKHTFVFCIGILAFWYYFRYSTAGKKDFSGIRERTVSVFKTPDTKINFIILLLLYALCYFALIHANYENADDIRRTYSGQRAWAGWSRYVSDYLSILIHTNIFIDDITPFTQFWTILFLSVTSYILAFIFTEGKITKTALAGSMFIGICPYFVSNFAYKFDCPYMALALLFGVFPFLFTENRRAYIIASFICLILCLTSYQASTSIYILMAIFIFFRMWLSKKNIKDMFIFAGISIACFVVSALFFKFFLMNQFAGDSVHRGTGIALNSSIVTTIITNLKMYLAQTSFLKFGNIWIRIFTAAVIVLFPVSAALVSKRNKAAAVFFSVAVMAVMYLLSFGAYLVLEQPLLSSRAYMGFDALIAIIALFDISSVFSSGHAKKITVVSVWCLFYGFAVFTTVYGNILLKQKEYEHFRFNLVMSDLSHIIDSNAHNKFYIGGITGPAGKLRIDLKNYNIGTGTVSPVLTHYLLKDYNMYFEVLSEDGLDELTDEHRKELTDLPLIQDTYYHTIYGKNDQYYIYLKNIPEKNYD